METEVQPSAMSSTAPAEEPDLCRRKSAASKGCMEETQELRLRVQIVDSAGTERQAEVRIDRGSRVADLKVKLFHEELTQGWRSRCVYRGRLLGDSEPLSQLPNGSCLLCCMHRPLSEGAEDPNRDLLLAAWARLSGRGENEPGTKWQDLIFHSAFAAGLALAWATYLSHPGAFDAFGRFVLRFFSLTWVVAFFADFLRSPAAGLTPGPSSLATVAAANAAAVTAAHATGSQ